LFFVLGEEALDVAAGCCGFASCGATAVMIDGVGVVKIVEIDEEIGMR